MSQTGSSALIAPQARERIYYGWVVLGVAALAMVGTLPGRTQGLGLITEPLLRDLSLSRVTFAQINLVATLVGALFCLGVGRLIDRVGSRIVLTVIAVALGLTVLVMSQTSAVIGVAGAGDIDSRLRSERAVGCQPRDGGEVVPAATDGRDGGLCARDEHRVHGRVSARGRGRAIGRLADGVGIDWRGPSRRTRAAGVVAGSVFTGSDRRRM